MAEDKDLKQAQAVYKALCEMLDDREWNYQKFEEKFAIKCGACGDDLPMTIIIEVDPERQLISLLSQMPFTVAENRRTALAIAVSQANKDLVDGNFDFNYLDGSIIFRMTSSYHESIIGKKLFDYMIMCSCFTIDEYNDKFLMVAKNDMSIEEILNYIK